MHALPRIIFYGTPEFAVPSLDILNREGLPVIAVVTAPDKPSGRGQKIIHSAVKQYALSKNIVVLQPPNLKDPVFLEDLERLAPELQIVVAFRMLPEPVWKMPPLGTFNLHASLLPQYRGAAPINWAIMNGETESGITTFLLQHEIDTGRVLFQEKVAIHPDDTAGTLHDKLMVAGSQLVLKTVRAIIDKKINPVEQSQIAKEMELKSAPKLNHENTCIDTRRLASEIHNQVRGLSPYPAAHSELYNPQSGVSFKVKIYSTSLEIVTHDKPVGVIETDNKAFLKVYLRKGILSILELQLSGRNRVGIRDFLNGFKLTGDWRLR
ncbi:MAG TPA: methionyl-tRNA formyltransferase [Bacteroidia bacterium]|nr:methionyl-tRNA formyltransferase [Bacteroidia bacterium]